MLNLNQQLKRVEIKEFEIENSIVFNYFDNLPALERGEKLLRAIYIGVLALMEDRLSAFLSKTSNELGTELESLKMIFDIKKRFLQVFFKGLISRGGNSRIFKFISNQKNIRDNVFLTANKIGVIQKNKTGDIVCEINNNPDLKIVIECKFDKSIKLGKIDQKDIFTQKQDTAWSQLLEAQVNREAHASIIVFDKSLIDLSITKFCEDVGYVPAIGFIAIVDSQKGDYSNLAIAYTLVRDIILNTKKLDFDAQLLGLIITRIVKDINEITTIRSLVISNIESNKAILRQIEKSILLFEFNQLYLRKFLQQGTLTKADLLSFYNGEEIKDKYKLIDKEISDI